VTTTVIVVVEGWDKLLFVPDKVNVYEPAGGNAGALVFPLPPPQPLIAAREMSVATDSRTQMTVGGKRRR